MRGYADRPLTEPEFARRPGSATVLFARRARSRRRPVGWLACGRGSVGRASPCQGEGRGFESRRPLGDAEHRRGQPAVLGIHGEPAGCGLIGRRLGSFRGGVAEWFRQGPAKPCTRVRFPSPPPVPERHLVTCPAKGVAPASRPPHGTPASQGGPGGSPAASSVTAPVLLRDQLICWQLSWPEARPPQPGLLRAPLHRDGDRDGTKAGRAQRVQRGLRRPEDGLQWAVAPAVADGTNGQQLPPGCVLQIILPSPLSSRWKMQQHYSGPVSRYILCISTASGK